MDIYLLRTRTTENAKYTAHLVQVWQQCRNCANSWHQFNKPRALNWGSDSNRTTAAPHNHDADILKQQRKTCSVATDVKYCEFNWMPLLSVEFKVSLLLYYLLLFNKTNSRHAGQHWYNRTQSKYIQRNITQGLARVS